MAELPDKLMTLSMIKLQKTLLEIVTHKLSANNYSIDDILDKLAIYSRFLSTL